jgi:hypothetical protein
MSRGIEDRQGGVKRLVEGERALLAGASSGGRDPLRSKKRGRREGGPS